MKTQLSIKVRKQATNISLNSDLLAEARRLKINLSAACNEALNQAVQERKREEWLRNNQKSLSACNELVEENSLFADEFRIF